MRIFKVGKFSKEANLRGYTSLGPTMIDQRLSRSKYSLIRGANNESPHGDSPTP